MSNLLRQAGISFVGTVQRVGAATMGDLPVNERTAIVRVDRVLDAPPSLAQLTNQEITLQAAEPLSAGEQLAFFTNIAVLGSSLAVTEVGRLPAAQIDQPQFAPAVAGAVHPTSPLARVRRQMETSALREHASDAALIVVGRIIRLEQVGEERYSEHAPHYWRATLEVQHVEKGTAPGRELTFIYPASEDVQWVGYPKPRPRQQGMWILHATSGAEARLAPFECLHPDDYRPARHLERLR